VAKSKEILKIIITILIGIKITISIKIVINTKVYENLLFSLFGAWVSPNSDTLSLLGEVVAELLEFASRSLIKLIIHG